MTSKEFGRTILVKASHNEVVKAQALLSYAESGMGAVDFAKAWEPPNSLITDRQEWLIDQAARCRLDATILMALAMAAHPPDSLQDLTNANMYTSSNVTATTSEGCQPYSPTQGEGNPSYPTRYWRHGDTHPPLTRWQSG
ncbi:hypothetical protein L198_01409 [Cryptococcus wingfieldii CBS 7118]|uniref:Uncharacterized protein n=1 Tax=Cryptococcus wingfieldii CBS 7118 TaxID=1295528 RepID=A0A1E3K112_9TREE|nr:hypothetical protein L198_01409 [Cryptococcus wingfieldii CBS 7118]ODO06177.1 hypothetical protein L198_01409 [Cryptococcus wingfieldii CBS 7118]